MKSKGFTLIELLAVIVILALIALVTIPMINNVIEKAKKGALEDSVYGLKSAAELYYSTTGTSETIEFTCTTEEGCKTDDGKKIPFKGSVEAGKVKLFSDGKVSICLTSDGYGSSILADEKKVTTKMGGCDEETYKVSEVIAIEKYDEVNKNYNDVKNALYNKTLISSLDLSKDNIVTEINNIDLNESEAENKRGLVDSLKFSELGITEDMSWDEIYAILRSRFNDVSTGAIWNYIYTGNVQTWTAPAAGLYKLEVWGAKGGGGSRASGGNGGYSVGYYMCKENEKLYIFCGGVGVASNGNYVSGGYNGGGMASDGGSGGGATHIATTNRGVLKNYTAYTNEILIVAGGGGGGGDSISDNYAAAGAGGGLTGGANGRNQNGGTQTTSTGGNAGGFGYGGGAKQGDPNTGVGWVSGTGGGGGWYGGSGFGSYNGAVGGSGGSGYIGGVPAVTLMGKTYSPSTSVGGNNGAGRATITYIAK